ncbi:Centrosomal protein of 120 kDa [Habropoda laboriosa]|uniref:Centrosomal protein of 120 kDa n=1 Tax=Habropoda laboriosa TaxID=597456 RepID=A0A0L7QLA1_9HYME|nr:Centrosomal protein of 120 kDa [Habropoda laboriosa]
MEELTNSDTSRVVLNIKEGKGFEKILLPTLVVATLNGHSLETEIIESSPNPQYDHDLVWEVDKSRLRKMRSGQVPLKLECFAVKGNDSKEKLGYLLLSLRSAQVFNKHGINTVRANWLKVLGLKSELKVDKPELLLALSIHDQEATTVNSQLELKNLEEYQQTNSQFNKVTPVLLRDERLIQLGPLDICHELFLMSITAVSATNVDSLLTTELYCMDIKNNLYFWCKILENDVYFNQSKKESGQLWILNEKIVIRIRSSLKIFKEYLNCSEIDYHRNPAGDFGKYIGGAQIFCYPNGCNNIKHTLSCGAIKDQPVKTVCSHSVDTLLCQSSINDNVECVETYHCYCLNISLISIKSISTKLTVPCLEIRFHHPKTENISIFYPKIQLPLGEKIKLHDIGCKLQFISAMDEIKQLLLTFPPKISIYKVEGNAKTCISKSIINTKEFFLQNKAEYQYNIPLYDMEQNNIGSLDIVLSLDDHGPYYRIKRTTLSENLGPPILDDSLAYKIVDELETWKERQIEIFKIELKRKEDRHLNLLSQEWQKQRESLETKLACSVEQCKMLANSLNNATEDLRTRRLKSLEKETRLIKANEDLQWRYETKLRDLKQTLQTMQEELMSKISALEKRKISLEAQVEQLSTENERLQLLVTKQSEEIETYQKGSLTQDQTANLLQELKTLEEKLQNAQENKSFFKEQWRNAVREIHRMKMEHQQAVQVQIKNSKEELQNLDLEEILCADSTALTNDQILLSEIQKEIDVIKPKTSFLEKSAYCQAFTPSSIGPTISQHTNKSAFKRSEAHNERLQALLEERDSLLKTGSYMMDDMVIMKLNNEIRSLMMK